MTADSIELRDKVRSFILERYLADDNPDDFSDNTPLITGGVLDSIATVELVAFLESTFGVKFAAHEINSDKLDTIQGIIATIKEKQTRGV